MIEIGMSGSDDINQLTTATQSGRTFVTHDDDFTRFHSQSTEHAGICYCHQDKYTVGQLLQALLLVHACYSAEEMAGHLEFL